jgi:hypothetical protein
MTILQWSKQGSQLEVDEPLLSSPSSSPHGTFDVRLLLRGQEYQPLARFLAMEIELATFALLQGRYPPLARLAATM